MESSLSLLVSMRAYNIKRVLISKPSLSSKVNSIEVASLSSIFSCFFTLSLSDELYVIALNFLSYSSIVSFFFSLNFILLSLLLTFLLCNLHLEVFLHHSALIFFLVFNNLFFISPSKDATVRFKSYIKSVMSNSTSSHDTREIRFSLSHLWRVRTLSGILIRISVITSILLNIISKGICRVISHSLSSTFHLDSWLLRLLLVSL